jgi:hemerythrin superfamily protein
MSHHAFPVVVVARNTMKETIMASIVDRVTPSITSLIRMDHTHVMTAFHRYKADTSPDKKRAIAEQICLALEIHAQLEEAIFYPALRTVLTGDAVLDRSESEHNEMREYIERLRRDPQGTTFDENLYALMRIVIHHVADEETRLLPAAERLLADRLSELGTEMTKMRLQLLKPRARRMAITGARTFPAATGAALAIGGTVAIGALLLSRSRTNGSTRRLLS